MRRPSVSSKKNGSFFRPGFDSCRLCRKVLILFGVHCISPLKTVDSQTPFFQFFELFLVQLLCYLQAAPDQVKTYMHPQEFLYGYEQAPCPHPNRNETDKRRFLGQSASVKFLMIICSRILIRILRFLSPFATQKLLLLQAALGNFFPNP